MKQDNEKQIKNLEWKLNNENLSDQEIEEILDKLENLKLEYKEEKETTLVKLEAVKTDHSKTEKRQKRSLYEILKKKLHKEPEKPATYAEIEQLRLDTIRAKLREQKAKAELNTPKKKPRWLQLVQSLDGETKGRQARSKQRSSSRKEKEEFSKLDGITGRNNNPSYQDIRKAFWDK